MKKKLFILILILISVSVLIYFLKKDKKNIDELTLYGNIEIRQVDLSFQVSGQISKMLKEEGDSVKKGELVAVLDDRDYRANYQKASASLEQIFALKKDAVSIYNRHIRLCKTGDAVSKQECDTIENNKDKTLADYKAALAQEVFSKNQLDYTKIYAPDEGIVIVRAQEPGATVNRGQIVYSVSKTKPVWIRAYINETDLGNIKYGMSVKVLTDTVDPKTGKLREYKGYVGYISPIAEFTPKTVQSTDLRTSLVYRTRIYIDDVDEYLRQGMPTTIKINLKADGGNANSKN